MNHFVIRLFFLLAGSALGCAEAVDNTEDEASGSIIWEYRIREASGELEYAPAVRELFAAWEQHRGLPLKPGPKGKVGLKVYTNSGPGLATPTALVRGIIEVLVERGWERKNVFILDLKAELLREAGFLPKLSQNGDDFEGVPVYDLQSGRYFDERWFYDSSLPATMGRQFSTKVEGGLGEGIDAERKSFLAVPLLLDADIWINLPMVTDHPSLGINGALANATLWNVSNGHRFLKSVVNAPIAAAEIAAIPELKRNWMFSLLPLVRYQYVGGPRFHALYTRSEPLLWLSSDPVALDLLMYMRINVQREAKGFKPIEPRPELLHYCERLHVGTSQENLVRRITLPPYLWP